MSNYYTCPPDSAQDMRFGAECVAAGAQHLAKIRHGFDLSKLDDDMAMYKSFEVCALPSPDTQPSAAYAGAGLVALVRSDWHRSQVRVALNVIGFNLVIKIVSQSEDRGHGDVGEGEDSVHCGNSSVLVIRPAPSSSPRDRKRHHPSRASACLGYKSMPRIQKCAVTNSCHSPLQLRGRFSLSLLPNATFELMDRSPCHSSYIFSSTGKGDQRVMGVKGTRFGSTHHLGSFSGEGGAEGT